VRIRIVTNAAWSFLMVGVAPIGAFLLFAGMVGAQGPADPTFNKNFEGGALGKIERLGEGQYRCFVPGQQDERGRNRQANWYYFRMDGVRGRDIVLVLTDFVGEYNDKPGAVAMNSETIPVFSYDDLTWHHFASMSWDKEKKEATLRFRPEGDTIWIAHVPPYVTRRLHHLLADVTRCPHAVVEVIGKTVQGRDLHLVTVTRPEAAGSKKKTVWLIARQHAWETGTSYVMEGALRYITSEEPTARALRDQVVFKFIPMMAPDGCANGWIRFNANGYDLNRHWDIVDLRRKEMLERMPEIWYAKKAILNYVDGGGKIDLLVNLHNTETVEYLGTQADDPAVQGRLQLLQDKLVAETSFDPTSARVRVGENPSNTTNVLYQERKIPVVLMEQRISAGKKLGRQPTVEDRLLFGKKLIAIMAETVLR
jgi:hypothetical protein